ncbi:hypothetical protein QUB70_26825 [Microcoleus sp. A003_D6]|uniref:hypothetical protein n=1 Tax=Microcoleus sp. A003_D6 TaxID=3055266 RepID=UPI002FCF8052
MYADRINLSAYICVHPLTSAVQEIPMIWINHSRSFVYNICRGEFDRQSLIPIQDIDRPADLNKSDKGEKNLCLNKL